MISEYLPTNIELHTIEEVSVPGTLYAIQQERTGFADELLLIRHLKPEDDAQSLLKFDIGELETRFYDPNTPNQWNIRLIWAYEAGGKPDAGLVKKLEESTRFAIRRCIPIEDLREFVAPLQTSKAKLAEITNEYDRGSLIENIVDNGLGFLFDDLTRDEKFDRLRQGLTEQSPSTHRSSNIDGDPIDGFVKSTRLGEFRETAHLDELDVDEFSLLYGRNGTGKTSILDATAMGLVGQIRHDNGRADDYSDLEVTLEGDEEPLPTDSRAVNDRVADWFGFRPHGPQPKHSEFYHINYHEAGAATRFIENDPDLDIDQTLRRLLYGEELEDVLTDKRNLVPRLERRIQNNVESIEGLARDLKDVRRKKDQVLRLFSRLERASEKLSPAAASVVDVDNQSPDVDTATTSEQNRLKDWTRWQSRFADLQSGCEALSISDEESDTAKELQQKLRASRDQAEQYLTSIHEGKKYASDISYLEQIRSQCSNFALQKVSAEAAFVRLVLEAHGVDSGQLATVKEVLLEDIDIDVDPAEASTVKEWREDVNDVVSEHLSELEERQAKVEELDELEERRQQLAAQIRGQTEEYLDITKDVNYCPACYTKLTREEILQSEKPHRLHEDNSDDVPDGFQDRISRLEDAKAILTLSEWEQIDYAMSVQYDDTCGIRGFDELWDVVGRNSLASESSFETSEETVEAVARALDINTDHETDTAPLSRFIQLGEDHLDSQISKIHSAVPSGPTPDDADFIALEKYHEERISDIDAALQVLEDVWSDHALDQPLTLKADANVIDRTVKEIETTPEALELPQHFEDELDNIESEIADLQTEIHHCTDSLEKLRTAFEEGDSEAQLKRFVEEHMTVISTLFKSFQRPYEFGEVKYQGEEVVVERRPERVDDPGVAAISEMSSGQRAALALAIFVTNNIAHQRAPQLMMLDEPFAHLDDINTLSFFNLLMEMARDGTTQIIFATANEEIADLLERKVGESNNFTRKDIPTTSERSYPASSSR